MPHHSAELCWCDAAVKDRSWRGKAYRDMLAASIQVRAHLTEMACRLMICLVCAFQPTKPHHA